MSEVDLMRALLAAAAVALPNVRLFRRNVGAFQVAGGVFRSGIKGQADIYGYERGGRALEIECKAARGKLRPEQEAWRDWCRAWGVRWMLLDARARELPAATVSRWVGEISREIGGCAGACEETRST